MQIDQNLETERLAALHSLKLLDTASQERFERITRFCSELFDCTISLISLVDAKRQWFLARTGTDVRETSREGSFCSYAIESGRNLLVRDALTDERFCTSPLVTGTPHIRSYLGQPIVAYDGSLVGVLCVIDQRPNHFDEKQLAQLSVLSKVVEDLIQAHEQELDATYNLAHLRERTDRLEKSNLIFAQAEKVAKIGSWELHIETGRMTYSAQSYAILERPEAPVWNLEDALNIYDPDDLEIVTAALARAIATQGSAQAEANVLMPSGQKKRLKVIGEYMQPTLENPARLVGIMQDVTEVHHAQMALQRAADYDALTNLLNRHAFDRLLGQQFFEHRHTGRDFFALLLDLDGFKDINDTFGHLVGDVVLKEISSRIIEVVPSDAVVARWGGDEFAVITPLGTSEMEATAIGENLIEAISREVEISGRTLAITATCGLARTGETVVARELLRRADLALYHGKGREPGRTHHYRLDLERDNRLRHEAISLVRSALGDDRMYAGYQPIVDLRSNEIIGFEALMRLSTRSGECLTAMQVLPAILDPVLSRDISDRMLNLFCTDFPSIHADRPTVRFVSLNATEADLISRDFADRMLDTLERKKIKPSSMTLEITETMLLVNDSTTVQAVLSKFRAAGMEIALDDFGTGFSSLTHLRDFPIDKVKIDGSFVQKMSTDHQTRLIVQALIAMAQNLGKEVIAEGVETEDQRILLLQMGCQYGQGYLFSPAKPVTSLPFLEFGLDTKYGNVLSLTG
jgi:diguanylate cyclase (GGDEF)-like protein